MRISLVLLIMVWLSSSQALAQESAPTTQTLRLSEVLGVLVQQSPTLAKAQINRDIANAQVMQSQGLDDYLLRATASHLHQADESVEGNLIGNDKTQSTSVEANLSKLLSTGGTITLHADSARRATTLNFNNTELTEYKSQLSARFDQPLLRGRGEAIKRATQTQAHHNLSAVEREYQAAARDEIRGVIDAYWELVWAHKDLEIRRSSLQLAIERRRITDSSVQLGSAPRTALLEVDQVMATNEEEILLAQQRVTERSLELRRLAGLEIGPRHMDLQTNEILNVVPKSFSVEEILTQTLATSPELAALTERGKSATIEVSVANDGGTSKLDLNLSAGPLGTDDTLGGAMSRAVRLKGYFLGAGLTYEQRLGNHTAAGRAAEAGARRHILRVNARELEAQLAVSVSRAVQSANIANKRMELSRRAIDLSAQNIEAERRRFESGKATNFDVLQRQEEQKQARLRLARSEVDYLRATIAIASLRGDLLDRYGISL